MGLATWPCTCADVNIDEFKIFAQDFFYGLEQGLIIGTDEHNFSNIILEIIAYFQSLLFLRQLSSNEYLVEVIWTQTNEEHLDEDSFL